MKAHSEGSGESGGGDRTRTFLMTLDFESMVEAPACWKLVGGGGVDAVSIASRAGKRAAAEDAWLGKVAVSTVMAALLRNGLDEAIAISLRSGSRDFVGVSLICLQWFKLIVWRHGKMGKSI